MIEGDESLLIDKMVMITSAAKGNGICVSIHCIAKRWWHELCGIPMGLWRLKSLVWLVQMGSLLVLLLEHYWRRKGIISKVFTEALAKGQRLDTTIQLFYPSLSVSNWTLSL